MTGAAFYHKFYNYVYSYLMDERIRLRIDKLTNCEDIGFNFMVAHMSRKPPIKVTSKWSFSCVECESLSPEEHKESLHLKQSHYDERSDCIQYFTEIYGYNPLLYSQFRADSVLFKTRLPKNNQKCFKFV